MGSSGVRPRIRFATDEDLGALEALEAAADVLLVERFSATEWPPTTSGEDRAAQPGFLLVAEAPTGGLVGFAHVVEHGAIAHLEQLAVHPEAGRRGHGTALLAAALDEAASRGFEAVTLRTYADVPWNAPFYARHGFVADAPATAFHRARERSEEAMGLGRYGRRLQMVARLTEGAARRSGPEHPA